MQHNHLAIYPAASIRRASMGAKAQTTAADALSEEAINNSRIAKSSIELGEASERYTLSADMLEEGRVKANGAPLGLGGGNALPPMVPFPERAGTIRFAPVTITFLALPKASNPQCARA